MNDNDSQNYGLKGQHSIEPERLGLARSLAKTHYLVAVLFFLIICLVNAWTLNSYLVPPLSRMWDELAANYDAILPEIVIHDGVAQVDAEQPIKIDTNKAGTNVIIVDTREDPEKDAESYLSRYEEAIILTRTRIFLKTGGGGIQVVELKNVPNTVLNSSTIAAAKSDYFPTVSSITYVAALIYSFFSILFTALLFALIPLLATRSMRNPISYGQGLKVAIFALAPVMILGAVMVLLDFGLKSAIIAHWASYIIVLTLASYGLRIDDSGDSEASPLEA
jgi:hypothetical protein